MKTRFSIQSALAAGFAATAAMTAFTFMAPLMGFEMDIPKMLSVTMGAPILIGWLAHFMVGLVLAVIYAAIFLSAIKKVANFKNGALFGIFPWLLAQLMVMPMMSLTNGGSFVSGLFSGSLLITMASLMGNLLYGEVLVCFFKDQSA